MRYWHLLVVLIILSYGLLREEPRRRYDVFIVRHNAPELQVIHNNRRMVFYTAQFTCTGPALIWADKDGYISRIRRRTSCLYTG